MIIINKKIFNCKKKIYNELFIKSVNNKNTFIQKHRIQNKIY